MRAHSQIIRDMARARPNAEQLFARFGFYSLQEHNRQQMANAIAEADAELIRTGDVEDLTTQFAEEFTVEAPTLIEGALSINAEEAQIDVTGDFRFGAFGPGPTYAPGIRVSYHVPYSGDREMFHCTASTRNLSLRPVELGNGELIFTYLRTDQDVLATKPEFDRELAQIKESLEWLRQDCHRFNATLPAQARDLIVARKTRLAEMTQGIRDLGVPIRRAATAVPAPARAMQAPRGSRETKKPQHYDIALSFAGENRSYVEEVADGLKAAGVSVFYDKFESANLWGKNLIEHLAEIYANSTFVVMFISKEYVEKAWTTHERRHAQERALFAQEEYILPARFDDTEVPGMTNTVSFQDLRYTTSGQLVELILAKLGRR
jgi:hypothetical protein